MNHHCHRRPFEVFLKDHNYRSAHMNPVKDDDGTQLLVWGRKGLCQGDVFIPLWYLALLLLPLASQPKSPFTLC